MCSSRIGLIASGSLQGSPPGRSSIAWFVGASTVSDVASLITWSSCVHSSASRKVERSAEPLMPSHTGAPDGIVTTGSVVVVAGVVVVVVGATVVVGAAVVVGGSVVVVVVVVVVSGTVVVVVVVLVVVVSGTVVDSATVVEVVDVVDDVDDVVLVVDSIEGSVGPVSSSSSCAQISSAMRTTISAATPAISAASGPGWRYHGSGSGSNGGPVEGIAVVGIPLSVGGGTGGITVVGSGSRSLPIGGRLSGVGDESGGSGGKASVGSGSSPYGPRSLIGPSSQMGCDCRRTSEVDDRLRLGLGGVQVVGVGARRQVLPAAVADDEHDRPAPDLGGHLHRPGQRGAGGQPGEDADLHQSAGPLDRFARPHDALAVQQVAAVPLLEHRRDVALLEVAQALDALAERRFDGDHLDRRVLLLEEPAGAHQRAARAEPGDEVGDLRAVLPDLRPGALVVGAWVGVVAVLVEEAPLGVLGGQRVGPLDGAVGTLGAGRQDDLGAEHLEHLATLDRHVLGQQDLDRMALDPGDGGEGDAGVA